MLVAPSSRASFVLVALVTGGLLAVTLGQSKRITLTSLKADYQFGVIFDAKDDLVVVGDIRGDCEGDAWGCEGVARIFDVQGDRAIEDAQLTLPDRHRPTGIAIGKAGQAANIAIRFWSRIRTFSRTRHGWRVTGTLTIPDTGCHNGVFQDFSYDGETIVVAGFEQFCIYERDRFGQWTEVARHPLHSRYVPKLAAGRLVVRGTSHTINIYTKQDGTWRVTDRIASVDEIEHAIGMSERWLAVTAQSERAIYVFDLAHRERPPVTMPVGDHVLMSLSVTDRLISTSELEVFAYDGTRWSRAYVEHHDDDPPPFYTVAANRVWVGRPRMRREDGAGIIHGEAIGP